MKLVAILTRISFMGEVEQIHAKGGKDHPTYQTSNRTDPVPNQSSIDLPVYHDHLMNKSINQKQNMKQEREIERREVEGTSTPPTDYRSMKRRARLGDVPVMPSRRCGRPQRGAGMVTGVQCSDGDGPGSMPAAW
jgi:hypothetical protein